MTIAQLLKQYDDIHMTAINSQNYVINRYFTELCKEVSPILKAWRSPAKKNASVWIGNKGLQKKLEEALQKFSQKLTDYIETEITRGWDLSNAKNDLLVQTYIKSLAVSDIVANEGMLLRNHEALKAFKSRIKNGMNLSQRVWRYSADIQTQLEMFLQSGLATGRSAVKIAADIKPYLINPDKRFRRLKDPETGKLILSKPAKDFKPGPGLYRSSFQNALRVAATETNMAYRMSDHNRWNQIDFIEGFEIKLSGSHPAPDICDHMVGYYPKSFVFTGWHPRCFCFAVPVLMKQDDFIDYLFEKKQPNPVNSIPIKAKKYLRDNTERLMKYKNKPYWLADNFRLSKGEYFPKSSIMKKAAYQAL